jgi:malate dehydrogenase
MADKLEVGLKLKALYDGEFYPATVVQISEAARRAKAPVKVHYVGYEDSDDKWLNIDSLQSKRLPKAKAKAEPKAKAKAEPKAKAKAKAKARATQGPGKFKVCVVGGAGGIGQPLSLLMAMDPNVAELCVYDLTLAAVPAAGVAADLSHINSPAKVNAYAFDKDDKAIDKAEECLTGCHLVLVPAGVPRKPGQDRKDLLNINAGIAKNIVEACAKFCPEAVVALIVNPVNSVVPAMCELWKKKGLNPSKIVGVTTLDIVRANKFVSEETGKPVRSVRIPVIGGHAGKTILPLFSQDKAGATIAAEKLPEMDSKVQDAGTVVVSAKNGKGSATLSMAFAGARLGKAVLAGLNGRERRECAYVMSSITDLPYFSSTVTFGKEGVKKVHPIGKLSDYEQQRLDELTPILKEEIQAGLDYAAENEFAS